MNQISREIEKKFLVSCPPQEIMSLQPFAIRQGYIAIEEQGNEVRIREKGENYYMTIKSPGSLDRVEVEFTISQENFDKMWPLTKDRRIRKDRFSYEYQGYQIEIDQYLDQLEGLWVAEVEFDSIEAANLFSPPSWMAQDVTSLPAFKNRQLASLPETFNIKELL
ncbi:MAG: CYTH domain-containing protein [Bacteroidota bacterium]